MVSCVGGLGLLGFCVSVCVLDHFSEQSANYGRQNNEKETATRPADPQCTNTHTHTSALYVGVERGITIISLLQALLRLISDLKEISCDRTRSKEGKKKAKRKTSHIHL